jgi:4-oxalocrotonate tautomerase
MPIFTIQVTRVTAEEKAALIIGVSELLLNVLNKPLERRYRRGWHR